MEDLLWDPNVPLFVANKKTKVATLSSSPFFLSDGQVLFFRDNKEDTLSLGPKERTKLELFVKSHKAYNFFSFPKSFIYSDSSFFLTSHRISLVLHKKKQNK